MQILCFMYVCMYLKLKVSTCDTTRSGSSVSLSVSTTDSATGVLLVGSKSLKSCTRCAKRSHTLFKLFQNRRSYYDHPVYIRTHTYIHSTFCNTWDIHTYMEWLSCPLCFKYWIIRSYWKFVSFTAVKSRKLRMSDCSGSSLACDSLFAAFRE